MLTPEYRISLSTHTQSNNSSSQVYLLRIYVLIHFKVKQRSFFKLVKSPNLVESIIIST